MESSVDTAGAVEESVPVEEDHCDVEVELTGADFDKLEVALCELYDKEQPTQESSGSQNVGKQAAVLEAMTPKEKQLTEQIAASLKKARSAARALSASA